MVAKSKGHILFAVGDYGTFEYYRTDGSDIFRAPIDNVLDCGTANRIGRFEYPRRYTDEQVRTDILALGFVIASVL